VSGDIYGYEWDKDNNILYAYIIDVMGHGIATAMQTSALRVLFQQAVGMNTSLAENESQGYCSTRRGALFRCALHLELSRQSGF
jgi:hypothetical protein